MAECCHHWMIDSPSGETSRGRCKKCGSERDFQNASPWETSRKHKLSEDARVGLHRKLMTSTVSVSVIDRGYVE